MQNIRDSFDATTASVASKVTLAGSGTSILGWASSSEFGMWAGIFIGLCGLIVNWYFKRQSDRRAQVAHDAWLKKLSLNSGLSPLEVKGLQDD